MRLLCEREDAPFHPSLYCVLVIYNIAVSERYLIEFLCLRYFKWYFIKISSFPILIFFFRSTPSFYFINWPNLTSTWLLIIFLVGLSITFGDFPGRLLKYSFHACIQTPWLAAFSLDLEVLFLLFTKFAVCHTIQDFLSFTECLILFYLDLNVFYLNVFFLICFN